MLWKLVKDGSGTQVEAEHFGGPLGGLLKWP